MNSSNPEEFIRTNFSNIALDMFPDNMGLTWEILSLYPNPGYLYDVTARSTNGSVGYNPVRLFVALPPGGQCDVQAAYFESKKGGWDLLASSPGTKFEKHLS